MLEDRHLGAGGRVGMEGGIECNEIFRFVLQVYNFVFKLNFFFKKGQPGALSVWTGAAVPETDLGVMVIFVRGGNKEGLDWIPCRVQFLHGRFENPFDRGSENEALKEKE